MSAAGAAACGAGGVAPFDISASPAAATGSRSGAGSSLVTSNSVAIVVTGGLAPVSYSWTRLTADQGIAISNASGSNVSWSKTMSGDADITETWRCTAADALGSTDSVDVIVELTSSTGA